MTIMTGSRDVSVSPGDVLLSLGDLLLSLGHRPLPPRQETFRPACVYPPTPPTRPADRMMTNDDKMSSSGMAGHGRVNGLACQSDPYGLWKKASPGDQSRTKSPSDGMNSAIGGGVSKSLQCGRKQAYGL